MAKKIFNIGHAVIGGYDYPLSGLDTDEQITPIDISDADGHNSNYITGAKKLNVAFTLFVNDALPPLRAGLKTDTVISTDGALISGDMIVTTIRESGKVSNAITLAVDAVFTGDYIFGGAQLTENSGFDIWSGDRPDIWHFVTGGNIEQGITPGGDKFLRLTDDASSSIEQALQYDNPEKRRFYVYLGFIPESGGGETFDDVSVRLDRDGAATVIPFTHGERNDVIVTVDGNGAINFDTVYLFLRNNTGVQITANIYHLVVHAGGVVV